MGQTRIVKLGTLHKKLLLKNFDSEKVVGGINFSYTVAKGTNKMLAIS